MHWIRLYRDLEPAWKKMYNVETSQLRVRFTEDAPVKHRISVCSISMDRLVDLKELCEKNIHEVEKYGNAELILLNYGSKDGMDEWAQDTLGEYITRGSVVYYSCLSPVEYFNNCHSRNISMRLGTGEILTTLDPERFMGEQFLRTLNNFVHHTPHRQTMFIEKSRTLDGRIAIYPEMLNALGGLDEDLNGHASFERDIWYRAMASGYRYTKIGRHGHIPNHEHGIRREHHPDRTANYPELLKNPGRTLEISRSVIALKIIMGNLIANKGRRWGSARLLKNFSEEIEI